MAIMQHPCFKNIIQFAPIANRSDKRHSTSFNNSLTASNSMNTHLGSWIYAYAIGLYSYQYVELFTFANLHLIPRVPRVYNSTVGVCQWHIVIWIHVMMTWCSNGCLQIYACMYMKWCISIYSNTIRGDIDNWVSDGNKINCKIRMCQWIGPLDWTVLLLLLQ